MKVSPDHPDAQMLMNQLSSELESITGHDGRSSFAHDDVKVSRGLFAVAYNTNKEAVGCGAIRPINDDIAEVKRMYAKYKGRGIGREVLTFLEQEASLLGYSALWLETRFINKNAVLFYESMGYHLIQNFGVYVNRADAACFEKKLI